MLRWTAPSNVLTNLTHSVISLAAELTETNATHKHMYLLRISGRVLSSHDWLL